MTHRTPRTPRSSGGGSSDDQAVAHQPLDRARRSALLADLALPLRRLHVNVLAETMANGVPVNPAAVVAVLAAHDETAEAPLCFTAEQVEELLWYGVAEFCDDYGLALPAGCREALHAILAIGSATGALHVASDSAAALFGAMQQLAAS